MLETFFSDTTIWFGVPALLGTAVVLLKLGLLLLGGDHGHQTDYAADHATDLAPSHDAQSSTHGHVSSPWLMAMRVASVQGIATFLMGFGWAGLALLTIKEQSFVLAAAIGLAVGMATSILFTWLISQMSRLQASGTTSIHGALGATGTAYLTIPARSAGTGQVTIIIDGRQRMYTAATRGDEIATGTRIVVTGIDEQRNTVNVMPLTLDSVAS